MTNRMAQLPSATFTSPGVPLYQPFGSGGGSQSTITGDIFNWQGNTNPDNLITMDLTNPTQTSFELNTSDGAGGQLTSQMVIDTTGNFTILTAGGVDINADYLSTALVSCDAISTSQMDLDGQVLTANPTELLLNGIPIATQSSLSSIADWALDPAISSINASGFDLYSTNRGFFSTLSSSALFADSAVFGDISTQTMTVFSTIHVVSTISSLVLEGQQGTFSSLTSGIISTPSLYVSSINGAEFTSTTITVQVAGVSSLFANSISSIGAEIRNALVSTIQFNPSANFSPNLDVNLGLGNLFGNLGGAALGGIGVVVGGAALGTGIAALTQTRQTQNINSNAFELVNGTTQLQISTLGQPFSTVYRYVSSVSPDVPGQEYFVSTVHNPGLAIRSLSDPLNTISAPTSSIQSFGQWVSLDATLDATSTFQQLFTSSLNASTVTVEGQIILNLSTLNSGLFCPYDAVNATTARLAVGLSTGSVTNQYSGFAAADGWPWTESPSTMMTLLETKDAENSFQYADLNVGRLLVNGPNTYGNNQAPYLTGDAGGSMTAVAGALVTNNFLALQKVLLAPSTCIYSQTTDSELVVCSDTDVQDLSQIACSALRLASTVNGANGVLTYGQLSDRALFLNSTAVVNTLAYTSEATMAISTLNTNAIQFSTNSLLNISSQNVYFLGETPTILKTNTDFSANFVRANRLTMFSTTTNGNPCYVTSYAGGNFVATQYDGFTGYGEIRNDNIASTTTITNSCATGLSAVSLRPNIITFQTPGTTVLPTISTNTFTAQIVSTVATLCSSLQIAGISTIQLATTGTAGGQGQPAGRLVMSGCDLDIGQNDLWAQQIRLGAGNPAGSAQTEVLFYSPDGSTIRGFNVGLQDRTVRVVSTINSGTGGYVLDTNINPPFFSTLNGTSTALMALFPSTTLSTIGYSTISVMPPLSYFASVYSSTNQTVAGANTSTLKTYNATAVNVGGFTVNASSVTVPVAGTYEILVSFQFATTTGGANLVEFWLVKNGAAVPQTNSRVSVANNADNLGTVSIYDTAAAGDTYGWMFYSSDTNMTATAKAAGATPAIPSIILNIRRLG